METPTQPTAWERTTIRRLLRWLFRWQTVRRTLIALAWVVTLIALLYGEENWRGRHAWNNYRQEQEARGAQFDLKAFIPEPIPDEQNFAATPFIQSWFPKGLPWEDHYSQLADKISNPQEPVERGRRHFNNLVGWKMAFDALQSGKVKKSRTFESTRLDRESRAQAAPAVLAGLKDNDAIWAELRAVSQRPQCRYPVTYDLENPWGILLPHLARIKGACQRLQLRASAELAAGQTDQAFDDVKLTLQLADTPKDEVFLVSYLVRAACFQLALQPVWEGLAEHRWSEAQLLELQTRFLRYDFLTDFQRPRDAERAAIVLTADLLQRHKYRLSDLSEPLPGAPRSTIDTEFAELLGRIAPRGWYHLEQVNACEVYRNQSAGAFDAAQKRISPRLLKADAGEFERKFSGERAGKVFSALLRHQILAATLLPGLSKLPIKVAMAQTAADQAALACALERFRLADGQFPEALAALVPRFLSQLPKDALTGDDYKYRLTADGQFVLYSVGWDEKDDGGIVGDSIFDEKEGDWVWQYPSR